ncbi:MAG TPA: ribonuclease H-like domain-containing protein [Bacteroidota bacterium]|nr:ribonuclease H-like domain-containing protein [Bacteroidota bacterium]
MSSDLVFDIQTLVTPGGMDECVHGSPQDGAAEDPAGIVDRLSLSPLTARILTVAMLNPATGRGKVLCEDPLSSPWEAEGGRIQIVPATEAAMLTEFWETVARFRRLVTFNGRSFDSPFLLLRSALLGVVPSRNLIPYRYSARDHCDLLDQLTFYGAMKKCTLESYCRGFGIPLCEPERPDIPRLAGEGRYREIALCAARTARATGDLYLRWEQYLLPVRIAPGS